MGPVIVEAVEDVRESFLELQGTVKAPPPKGLCGAHCLWPFPTGWG